ncbi:MAG: glycosyltransferase [Alphaproteobacteria bacterium]
MPSLNDTARRTEVAINKSVESGGSRRAGGATIERGSVSGKTPGSGRRLKVLVVSYWFPPSNAVGAIRVGHFAKNLHEAGHDVRVLAGDDSDDQSQPALLPADRVTRVAARRGGDSLASMLRVLRRSAAGAGSAPPQVASGSNSPPPRWRTALRRHYYSLLHIPDPRAPWIRAATETGRRLVKDWRPDVILASAPPNSGLIAARRIAEACAAPWIADMRDLWADNTYYSDPRWRYWVDWFMEPRTLRSATGLITVSPIWADMLRRKYKQPVRCILNGYVSEDFPAKSPGPEPDDVVAIRHTGTIYAPYRDPAPLFQGMGLLTAAERRRVAVHFYGLIERDALAVTAAVSQAGVADRVFLHDRVSYRNSLSLQQSADVLLLLQWNNVIDAGMIPAKFFEYLGAGRPILFIGYEHGNVAEMIRERGAGIIVNDPSTIAEQLRRWIQQRPTGIPAVPAAAREGLSRADQSRRLEQFLLQLAG